MDKHQTQNIYIFIDRDERTINFMKSMNAVRSIHVTDSSGLIVRHDFKDDPILSLSAERFLDGEGDYKVSYKAKSIFGTIESNSNIAFLKSNKERLQCNKEDKPTSPNGNKEETLPQRHVRSHVSDEVSVNSNKFESFMSKVGLLAVPIRYEDAQKESLRGAPISELYIYSKTEESYTLSAPFVDRQTSKRFVLGFHNIKNDQLTCIFKLAEGESVNTGALYMDGAAIGFFNTIEIKESINIEEFIVPILHSNDFEKFN